MQNWYINKNYKLLVNTQLFLKFDMWVMKFDTTHTDNFFENYSNDLFDNIIDIDTMAYYYNPIKIVDAIDSIDNKTSEYFSVTKQKYYKKIHIVSHNDIYNFSIENNIKNVFIVWIRKFDKTNYISPLTISVNNEYLIKNNYHLDLRYLIQEVDNIKNIKDIMSTFSKTILI